MKRTLALLILLLPLLAKTQPMEKLTLAQAYELAKQHYPAIRQRDLIGQSSGLTIRNLQSGYLPQVSLNGQASYQSDVTTVNVPIPGVTITPPSKDQYRILMDINQLIYDGGSIRSQQNLQKLNEESEQQKLEVELYKLKERISQLFLGVLYLDEQMILVDLVKADLGNGMRKTEAQVNNGVALRSSLNLLKAELLKADQRAIEISASRKGLVDVLGLFTDKALPADIKLEQPANLSIAPKEDIQRPELNWYRAQDKLLEGQNRLIKAKNSPRAGLFVQSGYGRPGLNMFKNDFSFYYTAGLRLSWNFGGLYTKNRDKALVEIGRRSVSIQQETFLLNTRTVLRQQLAELDKLEQLMVKDREIIDLRIKVKEAAKAQLENGVINANDYLREVNAEDQARQSLVTHQILYLQAQVNYQTTTGKQ